MGVLSYREVVPRSFSHKFGEAPTASRKFAVTLDGATPTQTIINQIGITFGSPHPEYSYLLCGTGNVTESDPFHAEVTFEYELPSVPSTDWEASPLSRPDVWSYSTGGIAVPTFYYFDAEGTRQPLVNTAGEPFEGVMATEGELKLTVTGNRSVFPSSTALAATNRVNDGAWGGGATGTWLCNGITATQKTEIVNGFEVDFWEVSASLSYRSSGHGVWLPNVGYNQLTDGELKPCTVEYLGDQIPASAPMPLDDYGVQKPAGDLPSIDYYETHLSANFTTLFGTPPA